MSFAARARAAGPPAWIEAFVVANVAFLGVDIALAHAANAFARREEWLPIGYSVVATLLLVPGLFRARLRARTRALSLAVGATSIALGVLGMVYHLESAFFEAQTLGNLVYSAPFVAPLAYVGVGLLLVMTRMEPPASPAYGAWIVLLALGGFVGNLALSLLDHAQNGFFRATEWIPVVAAAFGVAFLAVTLVRPDDAPLARACRAVLAIEALVGLAGFVLHVAANEARPGAVAERFVYGAPSFAPLLFTNLALLAAIGLWARDRRNTM